MARDSASKVLTRPSASITLSTKADNKLWGSNEERGADHSQSFDQNIDLIVKTRQDEHVSETSLQDWMAQMVLARLSGRRTPRI
jgi:hypothetical protein